MRSGKPFKLIYQLPHLRAKQIRRYMLLESTKLETCLVQSIPGYLQYEYSQGSRIREWHDLQSLELQLWPPSFLTYVMFHTNTKLGSDEVQVGPQRKPKVPAW